MPVFVYEFYYFRNYDGSTIWAAFISKTAHLLKYCANDSTNMLYYHEYILQEIIW